MRRSVTKGLIIGGIGLAALVGVDFSASAANEPEKIIAYRKAVMTAMGDHLDAMSSFAKGRTTSKAGFVGWTEAIIAGSKEIPSVFPKGTEKGGDTIADPAIWQKTDEFNKIVVQVVAAGEKLLAAVKGSDNQVLTNEIENMSRACAICHEPFRVNR